MQKLLISLLPWKKWDDIINNFKITVNDNGNYEFTVSGSSLKRFLADVFGQASYSDLKYDKNLVTIRRKRLLTRLWII